MYPYVTAEVYLPPQKSDASIVSDLSFVFSVSPHSGADIRVKTCRQETSERLWTLQVTKQCSCTTGSQVEHAAGFYLLCKCLLDQEILWFDRDCANSNSALVYVHQL